MAGVANDPGGRKRVTFTGMTGKPKSIRLGKVTSRFAQLTAGMVQGIVNDGALRQPHSPDLVRWIKELPASLRRRMERVGLLAARDYAALTLAAFIDKAIDSFDVKQQTKIVYKQTRRSLVDFFGASRDIRTIGPIEALDWRKSMVTEELAAATISKRVKTARQIFGRAMRWKLIHDNPLVDVKAGGEANPDRMFYIDHETSRAVIDACPDAEWRLLFGLSRYAGLRCPSEHLRLTWEDVDFVNRSLRVDKGKTKERLVPITEYLMPLIEDAQKLAGESPYLIKRYRNTNANLRTQFLRIIRRACLTPWPKLFHNLRSSCQTEWAEIYPIANVCQWIGNSEAVAMKHYVQARNQYFVEATMTQKEKAAIKATIQTSPSERKSVQANARTPRIPSENEEFHDNANSSSDPNGVRTSFKTFGLKGRPDQSGARSGEITPERMAAAQRAIDAYCAVGMAKCHRREGASS